MDNADYKIGRFTLKPFRQLLEGSRPVTIGRKGLALLSVLAKAEGALVTKDELMATVWPKAIVEDNAIQVHIAALRKVLGPDAELLSTVHGLGYRLAATPQVSSTEPGFGRLPKAILAAPRRWYMRMALITACVIGITAAGLWLVRDRSSSAPLPATTTAAAAKPAETSIAVLPFLNLSGNPADEYFSDGMTEEITLALVGVKGLKVVARSSAFSFKGRNEDVRRVGRALSATNVLEGSVRKQGNKLRISAELVRTDTGEQLWSQSYDRELKDVFAVQEDIATAITRAMQVPLGLGVGENLVANHTNDTLVYDDYLRALALYRARDIDAALVLLTSISKRDPGFGPAQSLLALNYIISPIYIKHEGPVANQTASVEMSAALDKADKAAHDAVALTPREAPGYAALGLIALYRKQWAAADNAIARALALDPTSPDVLDVYSFSLTAEGRLKQALNVRQELVSLEPYVLNYKISEGVLMCLTGDSDGAIRVYRKLQVAGGMKASRNINLAIAFAATEQYEQAAQALLEIPPTGLAFSAAGNSQAAAIIRKNSATSTKTAPNSSADIATYAWVYAFAGAPERYLDDLEQVEQWVPAYATVWLPAFADMRKTKSFKKFIRKIGLIDYWRATSWPDLCHPIGISDVACQ